MEKLGNPKSFCSRTPRGSVMGVSNFAIFGQFLNNHILASTNDRRLVLVSNIMFWDELSEKNLKIFLGSKKKKFWPRGGHFGYPRPPSTMKLEIFCKLCSKKLKITCLQMEIQPKIPKKGPKTLKKKLKKTKSLFLKFQSQDFFC